MTSTATATVRDTTALENLILVRLALPRKSAYTANVLTKDVHPFSDSKDDEEAKQTVADALQGLVDAGMIEREQKRLALTDAGRAAALAFLGLGEIPPKLTWGQCKSSYVLPKLLGVSAAEAKTRKKLQKADALCAALLKQQHNLPLGAVPSFSEVLAMVLCRELGIPPVQKVTANVLARWLLEKKNGERRQIADKDLPKHLLFALVDADKADMNSLRHAAIRRLLHAASPPDLFPEPTTEEPPIPFNLRGFAEAVLEAARTSPTGRFGDNKVFIHHVWKQLEASHTFPHLNFPAFQEHLVAANQEGLVRLSRLDIVDPHHQEDAQASETRQHNATFHLVQV